MKRALLAWPLLYAVVPLSGCGLLSLAYLQDGLDGGADAGLDGRVDADRDVARESRSDGSDGGSIADLPYVILYHFDGNTDDSSGNGHNGTLSGGANVSAPGVGGRGYALSCTTPGAMLTFAADAFKPSTSSFTIAFFFRVNLAPDGGLASSANTLFDKGGAWDDSTNYDPGAGVGIGYWLATPPNQLQSFVDDGFPGNPAPGSPDPDWTRVGCMSDPDGAFHHVALVVDRSGMYESPGVYAYLDAKPCQYSPFPTNPEGGPFGSLDSPSLGTLCAGAGADAFLDGAMDDFMIVAQALTPQLVTKVYKNGLGED
jgi:hypothetical protein